MKKLKNRYIIVDLEKMKKEVKKVNFSTVGITSTYIENLKEFYNLLEKFKVEENKNLYDN